MLSMDDDEEHGGEQDGITFIAKDGTKHIYGCRANTRCWRNDRLLCDCPCHNSREH